MRLVCFQGKLIHKKDYREFENFGNLLKQTLGYVKKVLARVIVNQNSELGEPLNAFEFVVNLSYG